MSVTTVETIDTHTLGEPTRIVLAGFPAVRGKTLKERSRDMLRRHGGLVRALMWEPRGHPIMFGALRTAPVTPGADLGLVFMDGGGTVDMCIHGTMGAVTALVESGRLAAGANGRVIVDTPAGPVTVRVRRAGRRVTGVQLEGVPSTSVATGLVATVGARKVRYDLAYAGNLIALVDSRETGVKLEARNFAALVEVGNAVKKQAQIQNREVVSALIYARLRKGRYRDLVVFREHSVDRSPCGSCVAALIAQLIATRRLAPGEWIECENLLGLAFRARLVERRGQLIPQIEGSAFITGEHRFRIDSRDPLRHGFQLA